MTISTKTLFIEKLIALIQKHKSYVCIGLDPILEGKRRIPEFLVEKSKGNIDRTIYSFNRQIIDATFNYCAIYKPQIAYYEKYNAFNALKDTIDYIHSLGGLVILDAKRNDIGSTSAAYADAIFNFFKADATTINGYFGSDGINPFIKNSSKGVFIIIKTSNKSSHEFQDLPVIYPKQSENKDNTIRMEYKIEDNENINHYDYLKQIFSTELISNPDLLNQLNKLLKNYEIIPNYVAMARIIAKIIKNKLLSEKLQQSNLLSIESYLKDKDKDNISKVNKNKLNKNELNYSNIGVVVGATYPKQLKIIRYELPNSFLLVPGYGAQGATAKDVINAFNKDGFGAIINSSRAINYAYLNPINGKVFSSKEFAKAAVEKVKIMREQINIELEKSISLPF
ncbi:MAG: orotidine-5'-phosphate decarboxylase [Promethearchaeota archaeon]